MYYRICHLIQRVWRFICTAVYFIWVKLTCDGSLYRKSRVILEAHTRIRIKDKGTLVFYGISSINRNCELRVFNGGTLSIGDGCTFNNNCYIACGNKISIGAGSIFGPNCVVVDHDHDFKAPGGLRELKYKAGDIVIGRNVWIAANVVILRNVNIGDNAVIGAGCIVSENVPANTVLHQQRTNILKNYSID